MLPRGNRWHIAYQLNPERERRLAGFAKTPNTTDPDDEGIYLERAHRQSDGKPILKINGITRQDIVGALEGRQQPPAPALGTGADATPPAADAAVPTEDPPDSALHDPLNPHTSDVEKSPRSLDTSIKTIQRTRKVLATSMADKEAIKIGLSGKEFAEFEAYARDFDLVLETWESNLRTVDLWNSGAVEPRVIKSFFTRKDVPQNAFDDFDAYVRDHNLDALWPTLNESTKLEHTKKLIDLVPTLSEQLDNLMRDIEAMNTYFASIHDKMAHTNDETVASGGMFDAFPIGIKIYTVQQVLDAIKSYTGSYKSAWEEWNKLRSADLAQSIGKALSVLPFGEDVQATLDRDLEGANDDAKDSYKKFLKARNVPYTNIEHLLDVNKDNGNRFRAVLEYAAESAWLYDFDPNKGTVYGYKLAAGERTVPSTWQEPDVKRYLRELANQNGDGEGKMSKLGEDMVGTTDNIQTIIDVLKDELENMNLWVSYGIVKTAMNKGKRGEVSPWLTTTILRFLRDNPLGRKYFPRALLDQIGNIGIGHPAWTTAFLKTDRDSLERWQKEPLPDKRFNLAGVLPQTISMIEADIIAIDPSLEKNRPKLDHAVSKVLATQTVEVKKGRFVSIYSDKYKYYRDELGGAGATVDVKKSDDDFFREESEVPLLGYEGFNAIFDTTSTGTFAHEAKVLHFVEVLISKYEKLKTLKMDEELRNYQVETAAKFEKYFKEKAIHTSGLQGWGIRTRRNQNELIVDAFKRAGFLSDGTAASLKALADKSNKKKAA